MRTMIFTNVYIRNLSTTVNPQQALLCNIPRQHQDVKAPCCGLRCNECTRNEILLKIKKNAKKSHRSVHLFQPWPQFDFSLLFMMELIYCLSYPTLGAMPPKSRKISVNTPPKTMAFLIAGCLAPYSAQARCPSANCTLSVSAPSL